MALKILLADDSMTAQNMGKKILVDAGYEVVAVSNGAAAIKKISSERPDIAILDEYMPGYTGSEVCERVKASAETAKIPVLLTVGKMEPFDQAKVNKVRADGVMIKPFEASDLIAAVQSIAVKLAAPAPAQRGVDATVQLRTPAANAYEDTLPVAPPKQSTPRHEDTLRLTPEEIKSFQDASYNDWANTAEVAAAIAPAAEMPVTPLEDIPGPASENVSEPALPAVLEVDAATTNTPVFSALAASGVAAEHEIFSGSATPVAPVHESVPEPAMPMFYTPPVLEESAPVFSVESPVVTPEPVAPVEEEIAAIVPIVEPAAEAEPATVIPEPARVLETSAPPTPSQIVVEENRELEPTLPSVDVAPVVAHELEITGPAQEHGAVVPQDPALATEPEDITEFTTRFGIEGAEPLHVGVATNLPEEQFAAIVTPVEHAPVVEEQQAVVDEPITPVIQVESASTPVEEEVGVIQAVEPVEMEPVVAYVPEAEQTQTIFLPSSGMNAPPPDEAVEPAPTLTESSPAISEVAPTEVVAEAASEPAVEAAPMPVEEAVAAVAAVADSPVTEEPAPAEEHASVVHAIEAALAAAAGTAVAGIAHAVPPAPAELTEAPEEVHEAAPANVETAPQHEMVGDAALAEELAAALAHKDPEPAHAEPAISATEPASGTSVQPLSDVKLADAVARAFENLKPQLITEIIKELSK